MKKQAFELFRLEDRVLFEAAAAAEIVEAAEIAQDNPNANVNEGERQAQEHRDALKNAPAENPAAQSAPNHAASNDPSKTADLDAQVEQLIQGEIPASDADLDDASLAVGPGAPDASDSSGLTVASDSSGLVDVLLQDDGAAISTGKELVVINKTVPDRDTIIAALKPDQEVLILDDGSGLGQLNAYLDANDTKYDAIHFVTHGNAGYISVNGEVINADHFDASEWASIGEHLNENGDILLYGCDTAATAEGRLLVDKIAEASGADVAASTDATGLHGNWTLEYRNGIIDITSISVDSYEYDLTSITVSTFEDLKDAIADDANTEITVDGDIIFTETITIHRTAELSISGNWTLTAGAGVDQMFSVTAGNVTFTDLTFHGANTARIMSIASAADVTLDGVTIQNGYALDGGGIFNDGVLTVSGSTFRENIATGRGGAIFNSGLLTVSGSRFENNRATGDFTDRGGGAILNDGTAYISTSVFSGNSAHHGGAVFSWNSRATYITDSTFYNNAARLSGGAVHYWWGSGAVMNCTFTENTVATAYDGDLGGNALFSNSIIPLINCIFVGNDGSDSYDVVTTDADTKMDYCIYEAGCILKTITGTGNIVSTAGDVFATGELEADGTVRIKNDGAAAGTGKFVWYSESYTDFAYSDDAAGTNLTAVMGSAEEAIILIAIDQTGRTRTTPTDIGAVNSLAQINITVDSSTGNTYDGHAHIVSGYTLNTDLPGEYSIDDSAASYVYSIAGSVIAGIPVDAGTYSVTVTGLKVLKDGVDVTGSDYEFSITAGSVVIDRKDITVSLNAVSKAYDGTDAATSNGGAISGTVEDEDLTFTVSDGKYDSVNATVNDGATSAEFDIQLENGVIGKASNYRLVDAFGDPTSKATAAGSIIPASLTVTATAQTITYGGDGSVKYTKDGGYTTNGWQAGDSDTLMSGAMGLTNATDLSGAGYLKALGTYEFTENTLSAGSNYTISFTSAALTVNKLTLTNNVSFDPAKVYDGTTAVTNLNGGLANVFTGDAVTLNKDFAYNSKNVANANTISATTWSISDADAGNYTLPEFTPVSAYIGQWNIMVLGNAVSNQYNGLEHRVSHTDLFADCLLASDTISAAVFSGNWKGINVTESGMYRVDSITILDESGSDMTGNYNINLLAGNTFTITPVKISALWNDKAPYTANGTDQGNSIRADYFDIHADRIPLNVIFSGKSSVFKDPGLYIATAISVNPNYIVSSETATHSYTMMSAPPVNNDSAGDGNNANYNATIPAMEGAWLTTDTTAPFVVVNPYTMSYSELVSLELQQTTFHATGAPAPFTGIVPQPPPPPPGQKPASIMTDSLSLIGEGEPMIEMDDSGLGALSPADHTLTQDEISKGHLADRETPWILRSQKVRMPKSFFEDHSVADEGPWPQLPLITDLLHRGNPFKSQLELILDEMSEA